MQGERPAVLLVSDDELTSSQKAEEVSIRRIKRLSAIPVALALTLMVTSAVAASVGHHDTPLKSCFGIASGQRASTVGNTGEHASSFDEPRLGIGNLVFRVLGLSSIGEAGSILASIDEFGTTSCD